MATKKKKKKKGRAPVLVIVLTIILSILLYFNFRGNNIKLSKDERVLIIGKQNLYAVYEDKLAVKIPFELYIDSDDLAWEHEVAGKAGATYEGDAAPSPSLKGSSDMLELGYRFMPENSRVIYDLHLNGWQGQRKGITGGASVKWAF